MCLEADQQLPQQPRELGLFLRRECRDQAPLGLEVAGSHPAYECPPLACEADEQAAPVIRVGDSLDEPFPLEPVDQVRHPAGRPHQRAVQLGGRATVGAADSPQGGEDVPVRAVQPEACEVGVQAAVEQGARAADASDDRDGRGVESYSLLLPFGQDVVDVVVL